jgi:metal transporter CNNM
MAPWEGRLNVEDSDYNSDYPHSHSRELLEWAQTHEFDSQEEAYWFYFNNILGAMTGIACVALIAGLFLGYLTLDAMDLKILQRSSLDEDERKYAAAVYPLVKQRHLLLVTLLMLNALAYEALPLFLDNLVPTWLAVVLSTTLVLLFGEILPSAIFTGPDQLALAFRMVPLVKLLLFVMYPVARPCAMLLDYVVHGSIEGADDTEEAYNRDELSALVNIQYEQQQRPKQHHRKSMAEYYKFSIQQTETTNDPSWGAMKQEMLEAVKDRRQDDDDEPMEQEATPPMEKQEVDVVVGALQMKTRVATDVFTPLRHVCAVPDDLVLDRAGVTDIYAKGYSRVPVYHRLEGRDEELNRSCVVGVLMTRQLMMIDWDHARDVSTLPLVRPDAVSPRRNLVQLLTLLRAGGSHMAFVCARPDLANRALQAELPIPVEAGFVGVVTLEDILESILQTRIYDERDIRDRDRAVSTLTRWAAEKLQNFARKKVGRRPSPCKERAYGTTNSTPDSSTEQTSLLQQQNQTNYTSGNTGRGDDKV